MVYSGENGCAPFRASVPILFPLSRALWAHGALHPPPAWSGPAARAGAGLWWTRGHIRRATLAWPAARTNPTALSMQEQQPGEDRVLVQPRSPGAVSFPAGSSLAALSLCSPWLAESREDPSAMGCCLFCSSKGEFAASPALALLHGTGCWALGLPSSRRSSRKGEKTILLVKARRRSRGGSFLRCWLRSLGERCN